MPVERGCKRAKSAADACKDADAVVTMLPAGKHVAEVFRTAVFGAAPKAAILIDCSTIDVATARAVEEEAAGARATRWSMRRFRAASPPPRAAR